MNTNEVIKNCLNNLQPKEILDLGIGNGRGSKRFLEKGSNIFGVDLINKGITRARSFSWQKMSQETSNVYLQSL